MELWVSLIVVLLIVLVWKLCWTTRKENLSEKIMCDVRQTLYDYTWAHEHEPEGFYSNFKLNKDGSTTWIWKYVHFRDDFANRYSERRGYISFDGFNVKFRPVGEAKAYTIIYFLDNKIIMDAWNLEEFVVRPIHKRVLQPPQDPARHYL